jgi:CO/xanthine dehydrogenase Mo-binding subunit
VEVDTETGKVKVLSYVAAHDVGKAINPMSVEGQIQGAIQMGIGYALCEGLEFDDKGKITNNSLRKYHMLTAGEMPETKVILVEEEEGAGPFGAKSIGECSVVPSAPAIVNAVINALGCEFYDIPLKPKRIMENLNKTI